MSRILKPKKPWNKGKIVGGKTPIKPVEVQAIRVVLAQPQWPRRDALMFAIGVDSSLRGADLMMLRVADLMIAGEPRERVTIEPTKTRKSAGTRVTFEMSPETKELLHRYVAAAGLLETNFLFATTRSQADAIRQPLTERAYLNRVKRWVSAIGLNPALYGTHSIRKVRAAHLYRQTGNLRACQVILGHKSITTTQTYLGIEESEALELSRQFAV